MFALLAAAGAVMFDRLMCVLRASAPTLTQGNIVNDASQSGRGNPLTTLRDESGCCLDDCLVAVTVECGSNRSHDRFRKRRLLFFELAQIDVPFGIKCENEERAPDNLHRLPTLQFDDHIGSSCPGVRRTRASSDSPDCAAFARTCCLPTARRYRHQQSGRCERNSPLSCLQRQLTNRNQRQLPAHEH